MQQMFMHLSRVDHRPVTKVLFVHTSVKMEVRFVTCQNHKFSIFLKHLQHGLDESCSPAKILLIQLLDKH